MKAILVLISILPFIACVKVQDLPTEESPILGTAQNAKAWVEILEEPNSFRVHLPVPDGATVVQRIEKQNEANSEALPMSPEHGILIDEKPKQGTQYIYRFGRIQNGDFEELKAYEIAIPEDKWIDQEIVLTKNEIWNQYRRIIFTENGKITTQNHQLYIVAEQLISEKGMVRTFPEESRAPEGDGLSGGNIQVLVQSAQGVLHVEMRGQHGAHGLNGADYAGPKGQMIVKHHPNGGMEISWPPLQPGSPAQDGKNGGNSGLFEMKIEDPNHKFIINPKLAEGKGGDRGVGGKGEAPHPASTDWGPKGADGQPGKDGTKDRICLFDFNKRPCWTN